MDTLEEVTEEIQAQGPGNLLTEARLKLGLDPKNVAEMLHLREHQIRALEADDYDNLPEPTYVKGYLRAYCQLLSLDPDSIIKMYTEFVMPPVKESFEGLASEKQVASSDNLVKLVSVVMVALVAGLAIVFWLSDDEAGNEVETVASVPVQQEQNQVDVSAADTGPDSGSGALESNPTVPKPDADVLGQQDIKPTQAQPEPAVKPREPVKPEVPEAKPVEPSLAGIRNEVSLLPESDANVRTRLLIKVTTGSWIDVRDARGNKLIYETVPSGREIPLEGLAPFSVFLGNADGVEVLVEGLSFDFSSFKRGLTARFKVNQPAGTRQ